ncbi:MAG: type II toxin-antitoxin system VapC family toxin [Chloroflexi bacterium]|nr:type II toxin-antitoxin system VapC family toxin [Chloroflexota bacterium]
MADDNWLLDTSILIDLLHGRQNARAWIDSLDVEVRYISVVTAAELLAGCANKREEQKLARELNLYHIAWIDEVMSERALNLYRALRLSHGVGFLDCLIAATALEKNFVVATLNLKHFKPIAGLQVKRPYQ